MKLLVTFLFLLPFLGFGQHDSSHSKWNVGFEQDILPYITGGYFAAAWIGKDHIRSRILVANVHKPDFILKKGFTNNRVTAYAITADYFFKNNWTGWWTGVGIVYWKNSIQSDAKLSTAYYNNTLLNGSIGYNWNFAKHFYLSPWAGLNLRVGGAKHVVVDGKTFDPPLLNPEAALKLGVYF